MIKTFFDLMPLSLQLLFRKSNRTTEHPEFPNDYGKIHNRISRGEIILILANRETRTTEKFLLR